MSLLRKAMQQMHGATPPAAPTPPRPTDPKGGLAGVAKAALHARGAAVKRQGIRLAKRLPAKPAPPAKPSKSVGY